jgi:GNAT superfamily N-acetyltransferase
MAYEPVDDGELATVVTYLEMTERPDPAAPKCPLTLESMPSPDCSAYRALFRTVGEPWLWFSRLAMSDEALAAIIRDPAVRVWTIRDSTGESVGLLELDFRETGQCELAFVGLVPALSGQGHGRWLLAEALRRAWTNDVRRVHVHTCTLDHPAALGAYRRAGFTPYKRAIERFPDPRVTGLIPPDRAPQIPLIYPS